jgi:hypothetical protein
LDRRAKVELFEQIRREYDYGLGKIKGVARKLGIHRRMVREVFPVLHVYCQIVLMHAQSCSAIISLEP